MSCVKATASLKFALVVALSFSGCWAADLDMHAFPSDELAASQLPACEATTPLTCKANLTEAIQVIQNPQWQAALNGKFSRVRLIVAPGIYRLPAVINMHWGRGQTKAIPLEIIGTPQSTIISGALPIDAWSPANASNTPSRVKAAVLKSLLVADLSKFNLPLQVIPHARGFGLPVRPVMTELFVNNRVQPLAGWPNNGYGQIVRPAGLATDDKKTFAIEGRNVSDWSLEPDLQVHAFWGNNWAAQSYLISNKDTNANSLTLLGSGSPYGIKPGQRARVENAFVELDAPGEWYVDRSTAKLYYWPHPGTAGKPAEISITAQLLRIADSENITVRGMVFEKTTGDAVHISKSSGVLFDNVVIRLTGNRGLVIADSTTSGIRNSLVEDNGEGGVYLSGGDRATLVAAGNFVDTCIIQRYSRLVKTYRYAVELDGVGQRINGSTISDAPHAAIFFKGNDHAIANNEIFNVVRETGDAGAIYVGRDFTVHGTVIENNFLHNIEPQSKDFDVKGIYLDDQASGIAIRNNVFAKVQQPVFIGGGRDNIVENNVFFKSSPAVHLDARGLASQRHMTLDPRGTLQRGLDAVPYRSAVYVERYPNLARLREDEIGAPKYNVFQKNIVIDAVMSNIDPMARTGITVKENSIGDTTAFLQRLSVFQNSRKLRLNYQNK